MALALAAAASTTLNAAFIYKQPLLALVAGVLFYFCVRTTNG